MKLQRLTTWDLVTIVLLGVVTGALNGTFSAIWGALFTAGGSFLANIILGIFWLGPLIAGYVVRKPGATVLCGIIQGLVELVAGTPFGLVVLGWTFLQALGVELGWAIFRYRRWDWLAVGVAGFMGVPLNFPLNFVYFGLGATPMWGIPPYLLGAITGVIVAGGLGKVIGDALKRTGVLRGLAIAEAA